MRKGESIKLYRGFAISSDERVRQGYKKDGEKYFKQCAGTGISYSLNRNVAGYFAMRKIMMENGAFIGGLYILWRLWIVKDLMLACIRSIKAMNYLPILLFGAAGPIIAFSLFGQPSNLGFAVFGGGICLASTRK